MPTILLVEDNDEIRELMVERLERKKFRVYAAADGQQAVDMARTAKPDVIFMDLNLPVLDGWAAARQLKASPDTRAIPVIGVTAHAMIGDREKALAAGCDDYDTKPIDFPRLLSKIKRLLKIV